MMNGKYNYTIPNRIQSKTVIIMIYNRSNLEFRSLMTQEFQR
jgi:hypothetical protein